MNTIVDPQFLVQKFQDKFETPTDPDFWLDLIEEEVTEAEEAAANLLKEFCDVIYCAYALLNVTSQGEDIEGTPQEARAEAFTKRLAALEHLVDAFSSEGFETAFERVHASNMSKLNDEGLPERREDGKILKGPNYKEPFLGDLIAN